MFTNGNLLLFHAESQLNSHSRQQQDKSHQSSEKELSVAKTENAVLQQWYLAITLNNETEKYSEIKKRKKREKRVKR